MTSGMDLLTGENPTKQNYYDEYRQNKLTDADRTLLHRTEETNAIAGEDNKRGDLQKTGGEVSERKGTSPDELSEEQTKTLEDHEEKYKTSDGKEITFRQETTSIQDKESKSNDPWSGSDGVQRSGDQVHVSLPGLKPGELCYIERKFTEDKSFSFTSREKIESADDVAYIFKNLEDEAIEHSFIVFLKRGTQPVIVHTGMGMISHVAVDTTPVNALYDRLQPDIVYMVHNHPSGDLTPSLADKKALHALKKMMPETTVTGIIIDTKSVKYSTFYGEEINVYSRQLDNTGKEQPIKLYAFDKIAFSKDYNPAAKPIFSQKDVAAAVSSTNSISDSDIRTIVQNAVMMNGTGIIIYGDFDAKDIQPPDNRLENSIYTYSSGRIELLATVKTDGLHSSDHQKTVKDDDEPTLFEKDNEPYISNTPLGLSENDPEIENIISRTKNNGTYMKAPNGKQTHLTEHQWAAVRTKAFKTWFGDWELANKSALVNSEKIIGITPHNLTDEEVEQTYKSLGNGINKYDKREVKFTNSSLGKILRHKGFEIKTIIPNLKEIYNNSVPIYFQNAEPRIGHKTHLNFLGYHNYLAKIRLNDKDYFVRTTVQEIKTRSKNYLPNEFHSAFVSDIKIYGADKNAPVNSPIFASATDKPISTDFDAKLYKFFEDANLAEENCSKAIDDNGEPKVVYHYTDEKFNTFDLGKSRQSADIPAFFFSSEKSDWKDLGKRIIPAFLNIKNPIDKPIVNMQGQEARVRLISLGYDGMITKDDEVTEYAAFNPNQIKSATDNNGVYSATNNDIRLEQGKQVSKSDILAPKATEEQIDATVAALKKTGLCKEGVCIVPDQKALDKAISDYEDKISAKRQNNLNTINDKFNEELQQQIDGMLPNGHIYQLGMPSGILLSAGIPDLPIELAASRLFNKSNQINHPFDLAEVKNLVNAIQRPLSIFRSATHVGSNVILTELKHNKKSYVVAIEVHRKYGKIDINSVRSVHYRNSDMSIVYWLNNGLADYIRPSFESDWLTPTKNELHSKPQYNSADVRIQLATAANIVKDFKNPNIPDDAPYQKINNGETMGATLPDGRIFLVKNNMRIDSAFHEFCHKLFTYAKDNKEYTHLYDAIVKVAAEAPEKINQFVKKNYPNLGNDAFLDEVFAWQESYQSRGKIEDFLKKRGVESVKDTMFAQAWYSRLWNAIKNLWNKVKSLFAKDNNKNEKPNYADLSVYDAYRQMGTNELEDKLYNTLMSERPLPSKEMLQKALPDDILDKLNKTPFGRTLSASYQKNVGNAHIQAENKNWNNQLRQYINGYRKILHNFRLPQNRFFNKTTKHGYVEIQQSILNKAVIKHNIDLHVLENLPQLLEESPIVFKSAKQDGSLVFVINAKDKNGKTIIVATSPEQNSIRSIHGRDNFEDFIRWADKGLLYDGTEEKLKTLEKTAHEYDSRDVAPQVLKDFFAKIEKFLDEKHKTERDNSEASQSNNPDVRYQSVKDENIKRDEKIKTPKQLQFDELRKMSEKQLSDWEDNQQKSIVRRLISNSEDEIYRKDSSGKERSDFAVWALKKIN